MKYLALVGSDGTIITNTSGGLGNLTFLWTGPNGYNSTSSQISNLYVDHILLL